MAELKASLIEEFCLMDHHFNRKVPLINGSQSINK